MPPLRSEVTGMFYQDEGLAGQYRLEISYPKVFVNQIDQLRGSS